MGFLGSFPGGVVPETFEREVSATPDAFARDLRVAWPAGVEACGPGCFRLTDGALELTIEAVPVGMRRLGLFELPQLHVRYRFAGGDAAARAVLLAALDRAMQRGGG